MSKIKCDLKKTAKRSDGKINHAVAAKSLNVFDFSEEEEEQNEKYGKYEKFGKDSKVEIVKGMKNGEIVVVDRNKDNCKNPQDVVSLNFINSLENKLSRVKNKRKIVYLNFPNRGNEIYSVGNKKKRIDTQNEDISVSSSSCSASVGSSKEMTKKEERNFSEKEAALTNNVTECEKRTSALGIEKRNQCMESKDIDKSDCDRDSDIDSDRDSDSLFNDPDILPNFLTPPKENERHDFLHNENESLCTNRDHLHNNNIDNNNNDNNNNNNDNNNSINNNNNNINNNNNNNNSYSNCSNHNNILPESSLAFKRKQFLEKINKKEEEVIFKKELNLYKDFKKHNIEIENYGKHILNKMGYDEKIYNAYINKYYNESNDSNYFDKIYEQFQVRSFRFTGIGAEEEMEENLEQIKAEGDIMTNKKNVTESTRPAKETSYVKKEDKVKNKSKEKYKDRDKYRDRDRNSDRDKDRDRDRNRDKDKDKDKDKTRGKEENTERKKQKYKNYFEKEGERKRSENRKRSHKKENETDETYSSYSEWGNEKKKERNQDLFEGLIVKINLKTHEYYKRKGIIIFKKRRKNDVYYGLLLFKNYGLVDSYKKKIKNKIEEAFDEKCTDVKYFWMRVIKELNKTVLLEKEEKRYDTDEIRKKIIDYFDITEVKGKYLETVIKSDCSKCKIVSTHLQHPRKKTSIYKETVELIKIKSNYNYAYIKLRKKYDLKVSLDDICECISYSVGG